MDLANRRLRKVLVFWLFNLLSWQSASFAQTPPILEPSPTPIKISDSFSTQSDDQLPSDFLGLADLRGSLNAEIATLQKQLDDLQNVGLDKANTDKLRLQQTTERISQLKSRKTLNQEQQDDLDSLTAEATFLSNAPTPDSVQKQIENDQRELAEKKALAEKVQAKIASTSTPEQSFKLTMSTIFSVLIGIVIVGFFIVALRDEKIRQAIFSGEAGIQFLTLFSLVIAIILFGITGILESKELAALLGGLSGYILGRVTPKA